MTPPGLLPTLLLWLAAWLFVPGAPLAQTRPASLPAPSVAEVQSSLDGLAARKLPEAEQAAAKQALEQTLENLKTAQENERQLRELKQLVDEAPARIQQARRELQRLEASGQAAPAVDVRRELAALEKDFAERSARLDELRRALAEANSLIIGARTRPDRVEAEIGASQERAAAIGNTLRTTQDGSRALTPERRGQLASELQALESGTALRRAQLAGNSVLQDLGQARRDLLLRQVARQEAELVALQTAINERRREQSEQTVAELSEELRPRGPAGPGGLLARETGINRTLSEFLLRTTDRLNDLTQRNLRARRQLDALNQADQTLEEQISVLQGSLLLTRILYQQKQALPSLEIDDKLADQIADLRLYQFEINQHREQLADPAGYAEQLLAQESAGSGQDAVRKDLLALLETRAELLERLNRELGLLLTESFTLQLNQKQLQTTTDRMRATLDEQMFWVPSNRPLDLQWLKATPQLLEHQLATTPWGAVVREAAAGLSARPLLMAAALLAPIALLLRRRWIAQTLAQLNQEVAQGLEDSPWHTPAAVLLNLLQALPVALLLAVAGWALQLDGRGHNPNLGAALIEMAEAWLVFGTALRILAPRGVAEVHFHWSAPAMVFLRRRLRRLGVVVLVLAAVVTIAEHRPAALAEDLLGILAVLACYGAMAWLLGHLLVGGPRERGSAWRLAANLALGLLPLALIGAVAFGYYYTALKLTGRLIDTLYVLLAWRLLQAMAVRWLAVAARRLARLIESRRREAVPAAAEAGAGAEGAVPAAQLEAPGEDLARINQQSLRVARLALLGLLLFALYLVWADLISVFSYLENIRLYEYSSGADRTVMVPISLRDLLHAALIVAATFALARNLPGLLEVLVLSRIDLAQGSAYAITTLVSYAIGIVGIAATLGTLGVSWDKLQWLVAALSVGLGFGLQEIFANFVSGLIILFERPARIGDVVTIGNLSGTVSRIRTRATTIIDFDRKEIIVPNKKFVTDQLINWTLSDTVTRVTVQLGVAYGSDLELVRRLLLQAARENPRVLADPAPLVVFQSFGASTLDHELRVHVRELGDRTAALDEINRRIDQLFREHGIEIAFGQMDVHLRSIDGHELRLASQPMELGPREAGEAGAAGPRPGRLRPDAGAAGASA